MTLSLNEYEDAENYLSEKIIDKNVFNKLRVIARYYLDMNYSKKQTEEKIKEYVSQCGESPSLNYWADMIEGALKRAVKTPAIQIDSIPIYSAELEIINNIKGAHLRRLAFTILCLAKYRDAIRNNNNHWICYESRDIMKMANIKTSLKNQGLLLRQLMLDKLIVIPEKVSSISMQATFVEEEGDVVLEITNMKDLGYQYLRYNGEPYFECENCGRMVKLKNPRANKPQKYCETCASLIKARQNSESVTRLRIQAKIMA